MPVAIITGSGGLVGSSMARRLLKEGWSVVGIDNDSRAKFFGAEASVSGNILELCKHPKYEHCVFDIANPGISEIVSRTKFDLFLHAAAQPSHDWSTDNIRADFEINALGTLHVLQAWRAMNPKAPFVQISTSKIFGDNPNKLPFVKYLSRYDLPDDHPLWNGIPEDFSPDLCCHSFFGVSKFSGDLLAQEFGRNLGLPVGVFRPGCVTGGRHKGVELHGFLSYLAKCFKEHKPYKIYGHNGLQLRDNIHADDLADAILTFANKPSPGAVYCIGGRGLECSMSEAISEFQKRFGYLIDLEYVDKERTGDHRWFVADSRKFKAEFNWQPKRTLDSIFSELCGD